MNILFVCHRFPFPPQRGGKIRPFNVIKHLSQTHQVTVASVARTDAEAKAGQGLAEYCHRYLCEVVSPAKAFHQMVMRLPTHIPFSMGYFFSASLYERIQQELEQNSFDMIFVHCSSVAQYVSHVTTVPKILDFGDMDSQKWLIYSRFRRFPLNMVYFMEGTRLEREEAVLAGKFDCCTCTTSKEMETLQGYGIQTPVDWFPNGVDAEYFSPSEQPYVPDTLCFIGRMDYYPNQEGMMDFCARILPRIRESRPGVKLSIVGADPPRSIRALDKIPGVTVTGTVEDVRPYIRNCAVNIAPLNIARGTQNKILESMAMGVPVVTTTRAAGGLDAIPGDHFLAASHPEEFAQAVIRLLSDDKERQRLSKAGRARVLSYHSWSGSMKKLDQIIECCFKKY